MNGMSEKTDAELVEMVRNLGDTGFFGELITRYQGHAYGLAYSILGDWAEAQDMAQEAFIRAYVNLHTLNEPARFPAWLRRIVFSTCITWLRTFRPELYRSMGQPNDLHDLESVADSNTDTPIHHALESEMSEVVLGAIADLPQKYRIPLTMFHLDGLSIKKVADFLDIPIGTVKSLINRARKKLRPALESYAQEVFPIVREVLDEHKLTPSFREEILERIGHWERFPGDVEERLQMVAEDAEWTHLVEQEVALSPLSEECSEIRGLIAVMEECHEHYIQNVKAVLGMIGSMAPPRGAEDLTAKSKKAHPAGLDEGHKPPAVFAALQAAFTAQDVDKIMVVYSDDWRNAWGWRKPDLRSYFESLAAQDALQNTTIHIEECEFSVDGDTAMAGPVAYRPGGRHRYKLKRKADSAWRIVADQEVVLDCGEGCIERREEAEEYRKALQLWEEATTLPVDASDYAKEVSGFLGGRTKDKLLLTGHLIRKLEDNSYKVYADEDENFDLTESRIQHLEICNHNWKANLRIVLQEIAAGKQMFPWNVPEGFMAHGDVPDRIADLHPIMTSAVAWIEGHREKAGKWGETLGRTTPEKVWLVSSLCKHISAQHKEIRRGRSLPMPTLQ